MPLFPILTLIVPLLGAGGTLAFSFVPRLRRYAHLVAAAAAALAALAILASRSTGGQALVLSRWRPSLLFGAMPVLQVQPGLQAVALVLAVTTSCALLFDTGRSAERASGLPAMLLALLALALLVLWSANLLALILSWAAFDLLYAHVRFRAGSRGAPIVRGLVLGNLATLLVWGGALLSENAGALTRLWGLIDPTRAQSTLWALAGVIRLALYPLHLSLPDELAATPTGAALLLQQRLLGWGLWLHIALVNGGALPDNRWLAPLAAATVVVGGVLAWSRESPYRASPWIGMAVSGMVLLAASLAGKLAPGLLVSGAVSWALASLVLDAAAGQRGRERWWSLPAWIGALALLGLPLTLGFAPQAALVGGLVRGARVVGAVCFFAGQVFLIPTLLRLLLAPPASTLPGGRLWRIIWGVGVGLPALWLAAAGLAPHALVDGQLGYTLGELFGAPSLAGWLLWALSLALGGLLAWQERNLRPRIAFLLSAVHDLLRLEWLYDAVAGAADRGLAVLRAADAIVGGAGALLWAWVLFLALLLVIGS